MSDVFSTDIFSTMDESLGEDGNRLRDAYIMKTSDLYVQITEWCPELKSEGTVAFSIPTKADDLLLQVLGYSDPLDFILNYRPETDKTMEALCGPHGYALFKALLIRNGPVENSI